MEKAYWPMICAMFSEEPHLQRLARPYIIGERAVSINQIDWSARSLQTFKSQDELGDDRLYSGFQLRHRRLGEERC